MAESITLDNLEQYLDFFHKMYDVVRLVDPVEKRVLDYRNRAAAKTGEICHRYWNSGEICDNCISLRAYQDRKSYLKLEQNDEYIMLVTALPLEIREAPVILELLKNATDSILLGMGDYKSGRMMANVVREFNSMVIKDHLTSLYNRRFVDERLPADIIRASISGQALSVIFIDFDNMKRINDQFGHSSGDLALQYAAKAMQNCVSNETDWVARYGGDEFVICLANADYSDASRTAQAIHREFDALQLTVGGVNIKVTASIGIHTMQGDAPITAEELLRRADETMYASKKAKKQQETCTLEQPS